MSALLEALEVSSDPVQKLLIDMRLLMGFPKHPQAQEWHRTIKKAEHANPDAYKEAKKEIRAERDRKIEVFGASAAELAKDPTCCQRCRGIGTHPYQGRMRFCGCPAGEKLVASGAMLSAIEQQRAQNVVRADNRPASLRQVRELLEEGD